MSDRTLGPEGPDVPGGPLRRGPRGEAPGASPRRKVRASGSAGEAPAVGYARRAAGARGSRRSHRERAGAGPWAVVVNWNGAHLLPACLDALRAQTVPVRVVVVDNGSTDASAAVVADRAGVEWLPLGWNSGFAEGSNAGIRRALAAGAGLVALVNNDVVLAPNWMARMASAAAAHPEAGLFCGLQVFEGDPARVNSTGLVLDPILRARDRDFGRPLASVARPDGPVAAVSLGAAVVTAVALRRIGLLDPAFFAYCEDADLSLRAARAGIGARYVASARAVHGFARTIGAGSALRRYLLARNHLRLAARHLPLPALVAVPLVALARAALRAPVEWIGGRPAHARAHLRAAIDGLGAAATALRLRVRGVEIPPGAEPPGTPPPARR